LFAQFKQQMTRGLSPRGRSQLGDNSEPFLNGTLNFSLSVKREI
jgi:hypothetical protein